MAIQGIRKYLGHFATAGFAVKELVSPGAGFTANTGKANIPLLEPTAIVQNIGKQQKVEAPALDNKVAQFSGQIGVRSSSRGTRIRVRLNWNDAVIDARYHGNDGYVYVRGSERDQWHRYDPNVRGDRGTIVINGNVIINNGGTVIINNDQPNINTPNVLPNRNSALSWMRKGMCVGLTGHDNFPYEYYILGKDDEGFVTWLNYRNPSNPHPRNLSNLGGPEVIGVNPVNGQLTNDNRDIGKSPSDIRRVSCP
jgi:hypothetical protein